LALSAMAWTAKVTTSSFSRVKVLSRNQGGPRLPSTLHALKTGCGSSRAVTARSLSRAPAEGQSRLLPVIGSVFSSITTCMPVTVTGSMRVPRNDKRIQVVSTSAASWSCVSHRRNASHESTVNLSYLERRAMRSIRHRERCGMADRPRFEEAGGRAIRWTRRDTPVQVANSSMIVARSEERSVTL
jgi:hypothetical protein